MRKIATACGAGIISVLLACGTSETVTDAPSETSPCDAASAGDNPCLIGKCTTDRLLTVTPAAANTPCKTGICDGAGGCVQCNEDEQCPAAGECMQATCSNHRCSTRPTASGVAPASQTAGDCKKVICDGAGGAASVATEDDVPNDGNACTADACSNGTPTHTVTLGAACSQSAGPGRCGSSGTCVKPAELAVVDFTASTLRVFGAVDAATATGDVAPARTLDVASPRAAAIDGTRDLLYVADSATGVRVYSSRTSVGAAVPVRTVTGFSTAIALALDVAKDRLFVADGTNGGTIRHFSAASTADGAAAAAGTITGLPSNPYHMLYDAAHDRLFVEYGNANSIDVIDGASLVAGSVARSSLTVRTIGGAATMMSQPLGFAYDAARDELYVGNGGVAGIVVFAGASAASGAVSPSRILITSGFNSPRGLFYDVELDELYAVNQAAPSVRVFASAHSANGIVTPARTISGAGTGLLQPVDATFFRAK